LLRPIWIITKPMKIKLLLSFPIVLALAGIAIAQSVTITPKKVTYRRPKPQSSFKKTFTIRYPKVAGLSTALNKNVQDSISYERALKLNLKEELSEYQWLEEADYEVNYNKKGVLVITLSMEGTAAYPSSVSKTVVLDLKTGDRVTPQNAFTNLAGLAAMCKKAQKAEIASSIEEIKKDNPDEQDPQSLFSDADFKIKDLNNFSVNDQGVTFQYNYGFPHVIQALQPDGQFFFDWSALKPYIKAGSLLRRLVR